MYVETLQMDDSVVASCGLPSLQPHSSQRS